VAVLAGVLGGLCTASAARAAHAAAFDPDNAFYAISLPGFFPEKAKGGELKPLNMYMVRRDGKWVGALATATLKGRAVWNTALMPIDASGLRVQDGRLTGTCEVTLVPDPWVPKDQLVRKATVKLDVALQPNPNAGAPGAKPDEPAVKPVGTWEMSINEAADSLERAALQPSGKGDVAGGIGGTAPPELAEASYDLTFYGLIPGTGFDPFQSRRSISVGVKDGAAVSQRIGQMDIRHRAYDYVDLPLPKDLKISPDGLDGPITFQTETLEGDLASFTINLKGQRVAGWVVGEWSGTYTPEGGQPQEIRGYFRGNVGNKAYIPEAAKVDDRPWFTPVAGHVPVQPGEHPRVFFRKTDLPELRRRAATPEGQVIIKRLRELLNGSDGESMPTSFNPATKAYADNKFKAVTGTYTISHAAGFGFLYQLTGDAKYAQLARECVEKGFAGQRNSDDRYAWVAPGGELRAGPSIAWTAVAYDLCYDAWPEDFRQKVALAIQDYSDAKGGEWNEPEQLNMKEMVLTPKQGPGSNHYGAVNGGCGIAMLAIAGDPGVDAAKVEKYLKVLRRGVVRHLSAGWGDGGYYNEGWGASRVGTQGAWLCFLQALRVARGEDYLNVDRPNASYVTMIPRTLLVLGPPAYFPYRSNMGPTYGNPEIGAKDQRSGFSHGGYFSEGFGAVADKHKPALLWTYNKLFADDPFDLASPYPHRAMLALINWPTFTNVSERNPGEILPLVVRDTLWDHFAFRNRFADKNDILTTLLVRNDGNGTKPRDVMVWGLGGLRLSFGENPRNVKVADFVAGLDGSGTLALPGYALAVDYSKASGADALLVSVGNKVEAPKKADPKARFATQQVGDVTFNVLTLSADAKHPEIAVENGSLKIGGQTVKYADGKLTLGTFAPAK
jgi:hypothetical protein